MSRQYCIRNSSEFRAVYSKGKRYDGQLMTVFLLPNDLGYQRLGITVSRKVGKTAVDRNRSKRLLREAYRLSSSDIQTLRVSYDWIMNARRSLADLKATAPLEDFRRIVKSVASDEQEAES